MKNNSNNWLIADDGIIKHLCDNQKKKHRRRCSIIPSDIELIYDKNKNPIRIRCLCCDSKRKLETFDQKIKEKIIKIYSR